MVMSYLYPRRQVRTLILSLQVTSPLIMASATTRALVTQCVVGPVLSLLLLLLLRMVRCLCRRRSSLDASSSSASSAVESSSIDHDDSPIVVRLRASTLAEKRIRARISLLSDFFITQAIGNAILAEARLVGAGNLDFLWGGGPPLEEGEEEPEMPWYLNGELILAMVPWLLVAGALSLRPVDASAIRTSCNCYLFLYSWIIFGVFNYCLELAGHSYEWAHEPVEIDFEYEAPVMLALCLSFSVVPILLPASSAIHGRMWACKQSSRHRDDDDDNPTRRQSVCRRILLWYCDMPTSRQQFQRFWLGLRISILAYGLTDLVAGLNEIAHARANHERIEGGLLALIVSYLTLSTLLHPYLRGLAIRWLDAALARTCVGRGGHAADDDDREHDAAVVSALIAPNMDAADVYMSSKRLFRAVPISRMSPSMMNNSGARAGPILHKSRSADAANLSCAGASMSEATIGDDVSADSALPLDGSSDIGWSLVHVAITSQAQPATLGEVDAFVTYSWGDSGRMQYEALHEWEMSYSRRDDSRGGREIDDSRDGREIEGSRSQSAHDVGGARPVTVWIDRACLDTRDINLSLTCMPVFLAGCRRLLVLAGQTYASRLWCAMELFIFVRMGGKKEDVDVRLILPPSDDDRIPAATKAADLRSDLMRFDAGKAKCSFDEDRHRLLAAIEAIYGTPAPFNRIVRGLLVDRLNASVGSNIGGSAVEVVARFANDAAGDAAASDLSTAIPVASHPVRHTT